MTWASEKGWSWERKQCSQLGRVPPWAQSHQCAGDRGHLVFPAPADRAVCSQPQVGAVHPQLFPRENPQWWGVRPNLLICKRKKQAQRGAVTGPKSHSQLMAVAKQASGSSSQDSCPGSGAWGCPQRGVSPLGAPSIFPMRRHGRLGLLLRLQLLSVPLQESAGPHLGLPLSGPALITV